jgi:uncharacterized protein (DUF488 family)
MAGTEIQTIGYGARTLAEFVAVLRAAHTEYLVDVRSAPYSRFKPEFSREPLSAQLKAHGVRYVFMGDALGGRPDDPGCYSEDGRIDYRQCRLRPAFLEGLARLEAGWEAGHRLMLMCSEGTPQACHRTKLIAAELVALGVPVSHIDERGRRRSHREIMDTIIGGQAVLFGTHPAAARSRKPVHIV